MIYLIDSKALICILSWYFIWKLLSFPAKFCFVVSRVVLLLKNCLKASKVSFFFLFQFTIRIEKKIVYFPRLKWLCWSFLQTEYLHLLKSQWNSFRRNCFSFWFIHCLLIRQFSESFYYSMKRICGFCMIFEGFYITVSSYDFIPLSASIVSPSFVAIVHFILCMEMLSNFPLSGLADFAIRCIYHHNSHV